MLIAIMITTCQGDKSVPVAGLNLSQSGENIEVGVGETFQLTATIEPSDATEKGIFWTSSNPSVASVIGGTVTGVLPGVATIAATTFNGEKTASVNVNVAVSVEEIRLSEEIPEVMPGNTIPALAYTIFPAKATNKTVIWSSEHPQFATVNSVTGEITGVSDGIATIVATSVKGDAVSRGRVEVTSAVSIKNIILNHEVWAIFKDQTAQFIYTETGSFPDAYPKAPFPSGPTTDLPHPTPRYQLAYTIMPDNATFKDVTWSTTDNDATVVSVDPATGLITALAPGIAVITVTSDRGGVTAECTVMVPDMANLGTNLLNNPGFEEPSAVSANITWPGWTWVGSTWLSSFYNSTNNPANTNTNRIPHNSGTGNDAVNPFTSGNAAFFAGTLTGTYAMRFGSNGAGVLYQNVPVTAGKVYYYAVDAGFSTNNNSNFSIKTDETLKILSLDGLTCYHETPFLTTPGATTWVQKDVAGVFVAPPGVSEVRFQLDQRNHSAGNQAPFMVFDNCRLQEVTFPD